MASKFKPHPRSMCEMDAVGRGYKGIPAGVRRKHKRRMNRRFRRQWRAGE